MLALHIVVQPLYSHLWQCLLSDNWGNITDIVSLYKYLWTRLYRQSKFFISLQLQGITGSYVIKADNYDQIPILYKVIETVEFKCCVSEVIYMHPQINWRVAYCTVSSSQQRNSLIIFDESWFNSRKVAMTTLYCWHPTVVTTGINISHIFVALALS